MAVNPSSPVDTSLDEDEVLVEWDSGVTQSQFNGYISDIVSSNRSYSINSFSGSSSFNAVSDNISGIFGLPYQFSKIVDPPIQDISGASSAMKSDSNMSNIGRKYSDKIFSVAPILFLTPGEPVFMDGYGKDAKASVMEELLSNNILGSEESNTDIDEGRYYSFTANFPEYKKYANVALRALALYMGIGDATIPVPGKNGQTCALKNIDVEKFMNNSFTKLFGSQCVVPFFLDAETAISESFSNSTTESMISQTVNGFSQTAKEVQFIMGSKDYGGVLDSIGAAVTDVGSNIASSLGEVADVLAGKNLITRVSNELTTIVSGGKIIFPEIWSDSEYDKSFDINIKLRSPDPDPISIFLNIYMPIVLLVSMAAPRQIGNSSNSYESPFLVRATYKSIFTCDLGMITGLSISKGGSGNWNVMGQPTTADVTLSIKDLYGSMFISKRMGLVCNTAQMDYLATMAGVDLNEFEPDRMVKLFAQILGDTPRDWASDGWGGIKRSLNVASARVLSKFADTRFLGY